MNWESLENNLVLHGGGGANKVLIQKTKYEARGLVVVQVALGN